jgi:signal transduction histidine kinase
MRPNFQSLVDWFIPQSAHLERSDLSVARNFVLTHIFGPLMSQSMCVFLYRTDPNPGFACYTVIACVCLFWTLPFVLRYTQNIKLAAILSVELLAFTALFGTYFYGGGSSPCLPWLIIALLLGFFYFSEQPMLIVGLFAVNVTVFFVAYLCTDFPEIVSASDLSVVTWISIVSATLYMSWMAIYYSHVMSMRSQIEKETERYLAANQQLEIVKELADAANRAKSVFLAKMSHELRTPLNAVIGYSELILENIPPGTDETKQKDVRSINAAGRHLLSLVVDVLDLSKIEAETIELTVEPFDVAHLLDQVVATVKPLAEANGNSLLVQQLTPLGTMRTDQTKLRQILVNLLSNASKFTKNGSVTLSVRMDRKSTGAWLDVRVRDTGIGISQADIARLFQNYRQVSAATAHQYGGTGLGLSLSQKLCSLMGGSIAVSSELGRGSVFSFCIPAEVSEAAVEHGTASDHTPFPAASATAAFKPALGVQI